MPSLLILGSSVAWSTDCPSNLFECATLGAVVMHYSISAALWLATVVSTVCTAVLSRSVCRSDQAVTS